MIIARSGDDPQPFQPRQPKKLPKNWSSGSPDARMLSVAGRYRQGIRPINAFTARDATTLDVCKHSILVVSLDSLAELHALHTRERHTGHRWVPLGPPKFGEMPRLAARDLESAHSGQAQATGL